MGTEPKTHEIKPVLGMATGERGFCALDCY